ENRFTVILLAPRPFTKGHIFSITPPPVAVKIVEPVSWSPSHAGTNIRDRRPVIERCRSMVSPRKTDPRRAQTPQGKSLSFLLLQFGKGDQNSGVLDSSRLCRDRGTINRSPLRPIQVSSPVLSWTRPCRT